MVTIIHGAVVCSVTALQPAGLVAAWHQSARELLAASWWRLMATYPLIFNTAFHVGLVRPVCLSVCPALACSGVTTQDAPPLARQSAFIIGLICIWRRLSSSRRYTGAPPSPPSSPITCLPAAATTTSRPRSFNGLLISQNSTRNLAIANRSPVRYAHKTLRASIVTP